VSGGRRRRRDIRAPRLPSRDTPQSLNRCPSRKWRLVRGGLLLGRRRCHRGGSVVDFAEPITEASASSSGCEEDDFDPAAVAGKVVLLQRGTCDFGQKAENAQAVGAVAAVIFNEGTIGASDRTMSSSQPWRATT